MAIESKNLLVWVKAMSRGNALPLDASEVYDSLSAAETYAGTATAYAGQTIKAKLEDGKYHSYTLQPSESGYVLEEVGALKASDLKQHVQVVDELPTSGQEQGVLYLHKHDEGIGDNENLVDGYIWTGSEWQMVFMDSAYVDYRMQELDTAIETINTTLDSTAPIANPIFQGSVKLQVGTDDETGEAITEDLAVKSYVDGMIANLKSDVPYVLTVETYNSKQEQDPGDTYRIAESGTYWGHKCEPGDLIIALEHFFTEMEYSGLSEDSLSQNYNEETGEFTDGTTPFKDTVMVVQANIDGAVTSSAAASTIGEIVVFDAVTGKIIKGSGVNIASLNDAIAKAHEHANATQLATYDKTQSELWDDIFVEVGSILSGVESDIGDQLLDKADKATTLAGYGITDAYTQTEIDNKLTPIAENLNTKITATEAESKIATAKEEAIAAAQELVDAHEESVAEALKGKADNATTLAGYGITDAYTKTEVEGLITTSESGTDTKINNAKTAVLSDAKSYTDTTLSNRVGAIPADTNLKTYIDTAVGAGGTASAEAIATAKQEAINSSKSYTDTAINTALTVVEF